METSDRNETPAPSLRFGPGGRFELRHAEYRLLVDGQPATLGGRALDLLFALAARPAELHTKNALLDRVWPGLVVEEGNLRVQINALRRLLGEDAIATVPGRGYRFAAPLHTGVPAAAAPDSPVAVRPAPTGVPTQRLFGRDADLARLRSALQGGGGCVTLAGTPGVGKSSLARVAVAGWAGRSAWVDLAPLTQAGQVGGAISRALGGQLAEGDPVIQLIGLLPAGTPFLLVLDNAEHLIAACAEWVGHLRAVPNLQLLVTSQLPLAVGGEQVLRLEPLHVLEGVAGPDVREGAMALLIDRIVAADSRFALTAAAVPLLAALCRQLDGLPLALEMVAARVPLMGLKAVHDALAERFALLSRGRRDSPARHRTLHDALDWSYKLLDPAEQRLFRALGVFAGGFTLDLAVALATDEHVGRWDVVDGLATLVERSLVTVSPHAGEGDLPRYRLLETMRAYALRRQASPEPQAADERPSLQRRHAALMLALFSGDIAQGQALPEMENAREAIRWASGHDLAVAAQLCARVPQTILFTTWRQEVTDWVVALRPAMQAAAGQALPLPARAAYWTTLAHVLNIRRHPDARPAARQAVALSRELGDPARVLTALMHVVRSINEPGAELEEACAALRRAAAADPPPLRVELAMHGALAEASRVGNDYAAALASREQEFRLAHELGLLQHAQAAETNVCGALIELGRHAEAAARALALIERIDAAGDEHNANLPWALYMRAEALLRMRAHREAQALLSRLLAEGRRFNVRGLWNCVLLLTLDQGQLAKAARLLGHVQRQLGARSDAADLGELEILERVRAAVHARFGADATAALIAEGRALSDDAAEALALSDTD